MATGFRKPLNGRGTLAGTKIELHVDNELADLESAGLFGASAGPAGLNLASLLEALVLLQ